LTRTVLVLSFVSLLADIASEMLYPVIPVYLREVGFSVLLIGLLEGIAEFTAGLSKGYFGKRSDELGLRLPFVRAGYLLSALSKPMMALRTWPVWIFSARTLDRLGKGLRTAARDALLSREATPATKARIFGFHRGMDTLGAVLGPSIALAYLAWHPAQYRSLFYVALVPGLLAFLLIFLLRERREVASTLPPGNFFSFFRYWAVAGPGYRRVVAGLLLFALFNSSDVFLLLKTKEITGSDTITLLAYIFYNLVFALAAFPAGMLADRIGMRTVFVGGLLVFAGVYGGFALHPGRIGVFALFLLYGFYAAATDGIAKAWITNLAHRQNTATAVGFYTSGQSVCSLLASTVAGLLWSRFGSAATFWVAAGGAALTWLYFLVPVPADKN
ncbi:MAG TPA: MFS transporter, partial [Chitinophagaceae bacterium]|nr:MFS transporter [Chitinophagaceae bacterium]